MNWIKFRPAIPMYNELVLVYNQNRRYELFLLVYYYPDEDIWIEKGSGNKLIHLKPTHWARLSPPV